MSDCRKLSLGIGSISLPPLKHSRLKLLWQERERRQTQKTINYFRNEKTGLEMKFVLIEAGCKIKSKHSFFGNQPSFPPAANKLQFINPASSFNSICFQSICGLKWKQDWFDAGLNEWSLNAAAGLILLICGLDCSLSLGQLSWIDTEIQQPQQATHSLWPSNLTSQGLRERKVKPLSIFGIKLK